MKQDSSTNSWDKEKMSDEWIRLSQINDERINFIMPFTFKQLGDVSGKTVLDLGCGEGGYSRELSKRGAKVIAVDCAEKVIAYCKSQAEKEHLEITYLIRNSCDLNDIENDSFDIVLASMMLMDCEDFESTIREIRRDLKPSGKLFASVLHPCFAVNGDGIGRQDTGVDRKVVVANYFFPEERLELIAKGSNELVVWRHRTIEDYVKTFVKCGLIIVDLNEPSPDTVTDKSTVMLDWLRRIPLFLFWELKK